MQSPKSISVPSLQCPPGPINFSIIWSASWCWAKAAPINLLVAMFRILSPRPEEVELFFSLMQFYDAQHEMRPVSTETWHGLPPFFLQTDVQVSQIGVNYSLSLHHWELRTPFSHYDLQQSFIKVPHTFPLLAKQHWGVTVLWSSLWIPGDMDEPIIKSKAKGKIFQIGILSIKCGNGEVI